MNKARMDAVEIGHDGECYENKRRIVWKNIAYIQKHRYRQRGEDQIINKEYHDVVVFDDEGFIAKLRRISALGAVLFRLLRLLRFAF